MIPGWPPPDAREYLSSDPFGELLLELVGAFSQRYPDMDFSDAIATVIVWFDRRLAREPGFLSGERFPTPGAFRAYVKQAVWNAARAAERRRRARQEIAIPDESESLVSQEVSAEMLAELHEAIESLPPAERRVFDVMHDGEDPPGGMTRDVWAASVLGILDEEVSRLYDSACALLYLRLTGSKPPSAAGRRRTR